jgi:hypothetical protein
MKPKNKETRGLNYGRAFLYRVIEKSVFRLCQSTWIIEGRGWLQIKTAPEGAVNFICLKNKLPFV